MNTDELKQVLDAAYEIEGLAEMALRRPEIAGSLARLIADKCFFAANVAALWQENAAISDDEEKVADSVIYEEEADALPDADEPVEYNSAAENEESPVVEEEPVEEEPVVLMSETEFVDDSEDYQSESEDEESEDTEEMEEDHEEVEDDDTAETDIVETKEMAVPQRRSGLRSFFSVNDVFRFRRELFHGSAQDFEASLKLVEAMENLSAAEDYFLGDLQWTRQDSVAEDFMEIIARYFSPANAL